MTSRQALRGPRYRGENLRLCPVDEPRDNITRPVPGLNLRKPVIRAYQLTIR